MSLLSLGALAECSSTKTTCEPPGERGLGYPMMGHETYPARRCVLSHGAWPTREPAMPWSTKDAGNPGQPYACRPFVKQSDGGGTRLGSPRAHRRAAVSACQREGVSLASFCLPSVPHQAPAASCPYHAHSPTPPDPIACDTPCKPWRRVGLGGPPANEQDVLPRALIWGSGQMEALPSGSSTGGGGEQTSSPV